MSVLLSASATELALLAGPVLGGFASAFYTRQETKSWYKTIQRPWFTPPNWVFPPAWTTLYLGMGYASYLVYQKGGFEENTAAWALYASQLLLNLTWSTIFFAKHQITYGLANLSLQLPLAAACGYKFHQIDATAGLCFVPLIVWLSMATALNSEVWRLNPDRRFGEPAKEL